MKWGFALIALAAGAGLACQVGFNSHLRTRLGHPIPAALANFGVGLACLVAFALASAAPWPRAESAARAPWWAWLGGVVGAAYVAASAAYARRLGAVGWLGAVVAGQLAASVVLDHYGLIGFEPRPIEVGRLLGVALLLAGAVLVLRG